MKREYSAPALDVLELSMSDVITTSGGITVHERASDIGSERDGVVNMAD